MTELTINIPDSLAEKLRPYADNLPELLERGFDTIVADQPQDTSHDEAAILTLLASSPTPEAILALQPSPSLQARASHLLAESKAGTLSRNGEAELERILLLERLVRLAKANAQKQRSQSS